jgi:CRP/FNR family cyclic AMP-dependent transcriptional regulator
MATKRQPSFDPKSFLAVVGEGRSIGEYRKDQIVFSQGDPADVVFYIQRGKMKVSILSEQGKEAVVAMLGTNDFFGERSCRAGAAHSDGRDDDGLRHRAPGKSGYCGLIHQ